MTMATYVMMVFDNIYRKVVSAFTKYIYSFS